MKKSFPIRIGSSVKFKIEPHGYSAVYGGICTAIWNTKPFQFICIQLNTPCRIIYDTFQNRWLGEPPMSNTLYDIVEMTVNNEKVL